MIKGLVIATQKGELTGITQAVADMVDLAVAISSEQGMKLAVHGDYDVIIVGVETEQMDGLGFLQELRRRRVDAPVLLISQPEKISEKMPGFVVGVDDVLLRPYTEAELRLRVSAITKHTQQLASRQLITYHSLQVNLRNRFVQADGKKIRLAGKEFDILVFFLTHRNQIISKEQLFEEIWGGDSATRITVVEVYLSMLRKKLRQIGYADCIRTLRNVGYILDDTNEDA